MKWVRENIATFGGDPHNVTIFGVSAGSIDASVLMATPLSKGLFERVIGESGSVIIGQDGFQSLGEAEKDGEESAARWNVLPGSSLQALRAISAADILKALGAVPPDPLRVQIPRRNFIRYTPVVDGYVFLESPIQTFMQGKEHRVALLLGSNSGDGVGAESLNLNGSINEVYGPLAEQARKLYTVESDPVYGSPAIQWRADTQFRCPAALQLIWHARAGNPSYQYEFARVLPGLEGGAYHSMEVAYVFGTVERVIRDPRPTGRGGLFPTSAVDKQISETMQQYWTNFAKTGDPNGGGLPVWPKFDPSSRAYIQFADAVLIAKEGLRRAQCDLFIENVKRLMAK